MIKNQIYIRQITPEQRRQLEAVASQTKLKTGTDILFYALEKHLEQQLEIARLNRIIQIKQNKIERLNENNHE